MKEKLLKTVIKPMTASLQNQFDSNIDSSQKTLAEDLTTVKKYHDQFLRNLESKPNKQSLPETSMFTDLELMQKFNRDVENKTQIIKYLDTIRAKEHTIGNPANKELLSKYLKFGYEHDYNSIMKVSEIIRSNSDEIPDTQIDQVGHTMVQLCSGVGDQTRFEAFSFFYQQLPFTPRPFPQANLDLTNAEITAKVLNAMAERDKVVNEISQNVNNDLNKGFFSKLVDFDMSKIVDVLATHKMMFGGGVILTLSSISCYYVAKHNPDLILGVYQKFVSPIMSQPSSHQGSVSKFVQKLLNDALVPSEQMLQDNQGVYSTVAGLKKQIELSNKSVTHETTGQLLEKLLDRVYFNIKTFFFHK